MLIRQNHQLPSSGCPRIPLGRTIKKIHVEDDFFHMSKIFGSVQRILQRGEQLSLEEFKILIPNVQFPSHALTSIDNDDIQNEQHTDSVMRNFILFATLKGVVCILLNIPSFLVVHTFHQMHFGTICQIFSIPHFLQLILDSDLARRESDHAKKRKERLLKF